MEWLSFTLKADICTIQPPPPPSLPIFHIRVCVLCDAAALLSPPWRDSGATQLIETEGEDAGKKQKQRGGGKRRGGGGGMGGVWWLGGGRARESGARQGSLRQLSASSRISTLPLPSAGSFSYSTKKGVCSLSVHSHTHTHTKPEKQWKASGACLLLALPSNQSTIQHSLWTTQHLFDYSDDAPPPPPTVQNEAKIFQIP